jgi:hypothetical protein
MIMGINGIRSGCNFPLWMQYVLVIYMISFIVLFGNFYAKAYIEKVRGANGSYVGCSTYVLGPLHNLGFVHTFIELLISVTLTGNTGLHTYSRRPLNLKMDNSVLVFCSNIAFTISFMGIINYMGRFMRCTETE